MKKHNKHRRTLDRACRAHPALFVWPFPVPVSGVSGVFRRDLPEKSTNGKWKFSYNICACVYVYNIIVSNQFLGDVISVM